MAIGCQWLLFFLHAVGILFLPMMRVEWYVQYPNRSNPLRYRYNNATTAINIFLFNVSLEIFVMILLIIRYTSIVICSISQRKSLQERNEEEKLKRKREFRLTVVAAVLSACIAVFACYSISVVLIISESTPKWLKTYLLQRETRYTTYFVDFLVPLTEFIFNFSNPYTLLIMSPMIRRSCLEVLHIDKYFYGENSLFSTKTYQISNTS